MILNVLVCFKEIVVQGRDFPWPRPDRCPRCGGCRLWGHGFVRAIFDAVDEHVFLRRFRCPDCGCVVKLRPDGYFSRFQASVSTIRSRIAFRLLTGRWRSGMSRSRQWYWLRNLTRRVVAKKGLDWKDRLLEVFDEMIVTDEIPVSRLTECALRI
ncbi:hypothetical protein ACFL2Q_01905 [Thermodesulfobacteriota bacterium]